MKGDGLAVSLWRSEGTVSTSSLNASSESDWSTENFQAFPSFPDALGRVFRRAAKASLLRDFWRKIGRSNVSDVMRRSSLHDGDGTSV
jgi:hypothetical protein